MTQTTLTLSASRVAGLVGDFDRSPAYAGLAEALRHLVGDGRLPLDARLPSERDLTDALGVSRTTVTRAYADLRETGFAVARHGSGTFTRVPGGRARSFDRSLSPRGGDPNVIDLNCAAASAPPGIAAAYADAAAELPAYLSGHGYYPAGLPALQEAIAATYVARGLPTTPEQIMVTAGALSATSIVARALTGPGDRIVVEAPAYPNAAQAFRHGGARVFESPLAPDGWDLDAASSVLKRVKPALAYLIPDFQNPTGHLMSAGMRRDYATRLRASGAIPVVDEAHQSLLLSAGRMPKPFAAYASETITLGSASKMLWGGLRLGWIRASASLMPKLTSARLGLDLGAPVLEQLVLARLLADGEPVLAEQRARLLAQRDALCAAVSEQLPDWNFQKPTGGLALWCELPGPFGSALAARAETEGVVVAPGPVFAEARGYERFVRIPWSLSPEQLTEAVRRLAVAWADVSQRRAPEPPKSARVMVA